MKLVLAAPALLAQANSPIKIGSVLPRQGPFALQGEATTLGIKIALEQANMRVLEVVDAPYTVLTDSTKELDND